MALWECKNCTTRYAVGLIKCPHCGSTDHHEDGEQMSPKISRNAGPSYAGAVPPQVQVGEDGEALVTTADGAVREPIIVGEQGPELVNLPDGHVVERPDGSPEPEQVGGFLPPDGTETNLQAAPDYESWTVEQLRDELGTRQLTKSGTKPELVARLREDDAAKTEEANADGAGTEDTAATDQAQE